MQWKEGGRYDVANIGHLFAYVECIEAYGNPGQPVYEAEYFTWFIAPDDEDKNHRRAITGGRADTREEAEVAIKSSIKTLAERLLHDLGA